MAQMARCCSGESGGAVLRSSGIKRRNAPSTVAGVSTELERLAGELAAELVHQLQGIFGSLVSQVEIHHGGSDLLMAQQFLDGVQMRAGLQEMSGKRMTQRMDRSSR